MSIEFVILDFDGTLTNVDEEAVPFVEGYKKDVAGDLGIGARELETRWSRASSIINEMPHEHGWKMDGIIVAPAYADPSIHSMAIARILLDDGGLYMEEQARQERLNHYYHSNYQKSGISFKEGVQEFLRVLIASSEVCVVTNSRTDNVARKLQHLPIDHTKIPIHGDAKKYVVDHTWTEVPEMIERAGYNRPLFPRRQQYWQVVSKLLEERSLHPEQAAVVGDIYELDLLMPEYKGMRTILTPRESTPSFELEAVRISLQGRVARSLSEVFEYLK